MTGDCEVEEKGITLHRFGMSSEGRQRLARCRPGGAREPVSGDGREARWSGSIWPREWITERRVSQPWGLGGGEPGAVGENWLLPGGEESQAERLPDKCTIQLEAGDVLRMLTPGGGGWGDPVRANGDTTHGALHTMPPWQQPVT